jgi:hypothetical protein
MPKASNLSNIVRINRLFIAYHFAHQSIFPHQALIEKIALFFRRKWVKKQGITWSIPEVFTERKSLSKYSPFA